MEIKPIAAQCPQDALLLDDSLDVISFQEVHTLDEMFRERVRRSPDKVAYIQYDESSEQWNNYTWSDIATEVERWQVALHGEGLVAGDRVAIRHRNSIEWVIFDQAALRLGLVVVPLYTADRVDNVSYVIANSGAKLVFLTDGAAWAKIEVCGDDLSGVEKVIAVSDESDNQAVTLIENWLPEQGQHYKRGMAEAGDLASIVYTSGTTGRPKGVMLSHQNMLINAYNGMRSQPISPTDVSLSFLPLSHTLERTVGYYAAMLSGGTVAYCRSIDQLADDLMIIKPTILVSVPRIFERVHNAIYGKLEEGSRLKRAVFNYAIRVGFRCFEYEQGRARWSPELLLKPLLVKLVAKPVAERLGGRFRFSVVGGAPLSAEVAKTFVALDMPLIQGYGLTETSPCVSVNTVLRNKLGSIGLPLRGVEIGFAEKDELCVRGETVMIGYWQNDEATNKVLTDDGWFKTGDRASVDEEGFLKITGRIKDILVLANGEKVPPADIEAAIAKDPLFEQVLVLGEARPFLSALLVLNKAAWRFYANENGYSDDELNDETLQQKMLDRIAVQMVEFPGYAKVRKVHLLLEEWTIESGLMTPTLKLKRAKIMTQFSEQIAHLYAGHGVHK